MRSIAAVACGALLLTSAAATAQTTENRTTFVTFSGPVSIPGKTLPAGTYTFKLADSPSDRHIVQIFDKDQAQIYATVLAVPAERNEAGGDPVITFKETPTDRPPAVHFWYYAGERAGNEFVYPKSQAMTIARSSGESVMSIDSDSNNVDDYKNGQPTRVTPDMAQAGAAGSTGSTASTNPSTTSTASTTTSSDTTPQTQPQTTQPQTTQPQTTQPMTSQPAQTTPDQTRPTTAPTSPSTTAAGADRTVGTSGRTKGNELPHTASEIPAIGLIGVFALAGALLLRVARRAVV